MLSLALSFVFVSQAELELLVGEDESGRLSLLYPPSMRYSYRLALTEFVWFWGFTPGFIASTFH